MNSAEEGAIAQPGGSLAIAVVGQLAQLVPVKLPTDDGLLAQSNAVSISRDRRQAATAEHWGIMALGAAPTRKLLVGAAGRLSALRALWLS